MTTIRDRARSGLLGCVIAAISLLAIGLVVLLVVAAVPDRDGLLLSVTAACILGLLVQFAVEEMLRAQVAEAASVVIGAPLVEESFKGFALLAVLIFPRNEID